MLSGDIFTLHVSVNYSQLSWGPFSLISHLCPDFIQMSEFLYLSCPDVKLWYRVATHSGKQGKQGKWWKKNPCREKSGNLKFCWKSGKNQGISKNLIFVRSKYSNFIAVQMWLLVVSFCHMLKIPADLILLKDGVLVRWSTCLLYILFFLFLIPKWTFYCKPNVCH